MHIALTYIHGTHVKYDEEKMNLKNTCTCKIILSNEKKIV